MSDADDVLLREFLVESYEGLDQLERDLVSLEEDPGNTELLAAVFRCIHTIKGTCGFLGFSTLERVSHVGENLLSSLRDGTLDLDRDIADALLQMVDAIRAHLGSIERSGAESDGDDHALVDRLVELNDPGARRDAATSEPPAETGAGTPATEEADEAATTEADEPDPEPEDASVAPELGDSEAESARGPDAEAEASRDPSPTGVSGSSIRVDVGVLDKLMNLVGELVLARNQVLQRGAAREDAMLTAAAQRLDLVTTELQEGIMQTRMQPIGNVWRKFPRVVRDLASACGKKVRIEMEGRETEVDRTLIEAIKDPLTHIVRNSVDHGIERPDDRVAAGKSEEGKLTLRAFHEGGQVNIEVSDDGAGIDPDRLRTIACQRGVITAEEAARLDDRRAVALVFRAGFSTAHEVTNVSGRGVGMDVVRSNIEQIGGSVEIISRRGRGTTLKIKIPLTLAIIPALVVTCGDDRFAIPQVSVLELVRLEGEAVRTRVERIHGAPVYRLRGKLLPLVDLRAQLEFPPRGDDGFVNVVVLQADGRPFGLVVDDVHDSEDIVVKPLSQQLKAIPAFAGATVMGDGTVVLILDVIGLAQQAHVVSDSERRAEHELDSNGEATESDGETLLVFRVGEDWRMAMPLGDVARLEEFAVDAVERTGDRTVVQYRGDIMPLVRLSDLFGVPRTPDDGGALQVVVAAAGGHNVGLVVDRILDIVDERIAARRASSRDGVRESVVVQGVVTDMLDVEHVIRVADPTLLEPALA